MTDRSTPLRYVIAGLTVASEIPLPGLIAGGGDQVDADATIRAGSVPRDLPGAASSGPNWQLSGGRFLIAIPEIVRMLITDGREIVFDLEDGVTVAEAAIFISGTGFGLLLHQRGHIVLHASAVRVGQGAVLFCGPSGAGKSTLAASLVERGYDLVTDDFCAVSLREDGSLWIEPDGRQLKLWQHSIDRLDLVERQSAPVRPQIGKFYVEPRNVAAEPLPLTALYLLQEERANMRPGISQPNVVDRGLIVRRNAYRPAMVRHFEQTGHYFMAAAAITERAGVFELIRAMNFDHFPEVISWLEAHWRERGLLDA